jgi:hypothetical protein
MGIPGNRLPPADRLPTIDERDGLDPSVGKHTACGTTAIPSPAAAGETSVCGAAQRLLAPYAHDFVGELATFTRANYPNRDITGRAPPMPRPKGST